MIAGQQKELSLSFGALAPSLYAQLAGQKVTMDREKLEHLQRDADAITRLLVRGIMTETQGRVARQKLMKNIAASR